MAQQPRNFSISLAKMPAPQWSALAPIKVGAYEGNLSNPQDFVLVSEGDAPFLRIAVYTPHDDYHLRCEADIWRDWVLVGFGRQVAIVPLAGGDVCGFSLSDPALDTLFDYFCRFYCDADHAFASSGRRVFRIGADGSLMWTSPEVGLDGVLVHDVSAGLVTGDGEWDPPGGWLPFTLALDTGVLLCGER